MKEGEARGGKGKRNSLWGNRKEYGRITVKTDRGGVKSKGVSLVLNKGTYY